MAEQRLIVLINGGVVGDLDQDARGRLSFTYSDRWRDMPAPTPLSLSMPVAQHSHSDRVVRPYLRNLLPDSEPVLRRWGARFGVSHNNPFALLRHVGKDVAGAAQYVAQDRLSEATTGGGLDPVDTDYIAGRLAALREDRSAWDDTRSPGRFSLAGAQSKFALRRLAGGGWAIPWGSEATTHIFKPSLPHHAHQEVNEHLCLQTAERLGLPAARSEVGVFGDEAAIVVERYDRRREPDGSVLRVHQEDVCQALGVDPDRKYQRGDGGPSGADVIRLIRDSHRPLLAEQDAVERFCRSLALNWVIYGPDAHAKNYSLLLQDRAVRLAPLYDVSSVAAYPDRYDLRTMAMAMSIDGKYENRLVTGESWRRFAGAVGVEPELMAGWVADMVERTPQALHDAVIAEPSWVQDLPMTKALLNGVADAAAERARFL